jgi:A/G-specific adenine glycosylase
MISWRLAIAPAEGSERSGAREALRAWFRPRRGAYAWRRRPDPYSTLVSEVMLQQTQASRVEPLFSAFVERFPNVGELAAAPRADVIRAWTGLGYNRRAVALHEAARTIVRDFGGIVPAELEALRSLPGVGPYTAAAVASIAYGVTVPAVDTNVRRVVVRFHRGVDPDEGHAVEVDGLADRWLDPRDPGGWNQAVMDVGREHCRPAPRCAAGPLAPWCRYRAKGRTERRPGRAQPPFEGSMRQVRGRVLAALRASDAARPSDLAAHTGFDLPRVRRALEGLIADGLVVRSRGRYQLPT